MRETTTAANDHSNAERRIATSLLSISGLILLAKMVAALKEAVVASHYGISAKMDAYIYLFNSLNWPVGVWLSILTAVVVPAVVRLRVSDPQAINAFRREFFGLTIIAAIATTVVAGLTLSIVLGRNLPGMSSAALGLAKTILGPMLLMIPAGFVAALLSVHLMSQQRHILNLLEGLPALTIMISALVFPATSVWPLVWGTIGGLVIQSLFLAISQQQFDLLGFPRFGFSSHVWLTFSAGLATVVGSQILQSVTDVVDQNMVAHLGVGANSTLGYATRLLSIALTLGASAMTRALLPIISHVQNSEPALAAKITFRWALLAFSAGTAIALIGWFLSPLAVELIYQRGAFTAFDSVATANVVRAGLFQFPFFMAGIVLVQLLISRGRFVVLIYLGAICLTVKIVANLLFVRQMGVSGAMLSTTATYMVSMITLLYFCIRSAVAVDGRGSKS